MFKTAEKGTRDPKTKQKTSLKIREKLKGAFCCVKYCKLIVKSNKHNDSVESVVLALYLLGVGLIPKFVASHSISHIVFGKVQWLTSQRTPIPQAVQ